MARSWLKQQLHHNQMMVDLGQLMHSCSKPSVARVSHTHSLEYSVAHSECDCHSGSISVSADIVTRGH